MDHPDLTASNFIENYKDTPSIFKDYNFRGESRISGKGFIYIKMLGFRFADFISFFLNIP